MKNFITKIVLSVIFITVFGSLSWAQPANNNCSTATSFGSLPTPGACSSGLQDGATVTLSNQTTVGATGASPYVYLTGCTGGGPMQAPALDTWYSFTATGTILNLSIAGFPNASVGIWGGTCGTPTGIACLNVPAGGNGTITIPSLTIGNTYYIQISGGTSSATDSNFSITLDNDIDCNDCLRASTLTATPAPVNGTYAPGQVVRFCYTVTQWVETSANWFHGVQISMGPGWTGAITGTTPATQCGYNPPGPGDPGAGVWAFYNSVTSSATGSTFGPGFFFDNANVAGSDPGQNFGDVTDGTCTWTFCWDLTVSSTCVAGQSLSVSVNTTGDGESGSWSSVACQSDPANTFNAVMSPGPVMTSANAVTICSNQSVGLALTANIPSTFSWIATANPNVTGESTTAQSGNTINNVLVNTTSVTQVVTYTVTPTSSPGGCPGTPQTVLVTVNPTPTATISYA
ncbi:PKD-like domain-containing protein, partial [Flavobacterium cauense]